MWAVIVIVIAVIVIIFGVKRLLTPRFEVRQLRDGKYAVLAKNSLWNIGWQKYRTEYTDSCKIEQNFGSQLASILHEDFEAAKTVADKGQARYGKIKKAQGKKVYSPCEEKDTDLLEQIGRACARNDEEKVEKLLKQLER